MSSNTTGWGVTAGSPTPQAREQEHVVLIPLAQSDPEYLHAQAQIPQGRNGVMWHGVSGGGAGQGQGLRVTSQLPFSFFILAGN